MKEPVAGPGTGKWGGVGDKWAGRASPSHGFGATGGPALPGFPVAAAEGQGITEVVAWFAPLLSGGGRPALAGDGFPHPLKLVAPEFTRLGQDIRCRARIA